jgi:hypothetical protein
MSSKIFLPEIINYGKEMALLKKEIDLKLSELNEKYKEKAVFSLQCPNIKVVYNHPTLNRETTTYYPNLDLDMPL